MKGGSLLRLFSYGPSKQDSKAGYNSPKLVNKRSLLDFALRYTQEISPIPESYEHFITSVTCENILSSNFLQGEVKFEPFLFIDRVDRE
jgi:hypothetical protein